MTKRFKVVGKGADTGIIKDKYNKCPLSGVEFSFTVANCIVDWLNENTKEYKRFVLKENKVSSLAGYTLWDNEKEEHIKYIPRIDIGNPKLALEDYIDFLNKLWEGNAHD